MMDLAAIDDLVIATAKRSFAAIAALSRGLTVRGMEASFLTQRERGTAC
ncbi:MAG: hypothetical protein QN178_05780 [Armatimonadota bacterium]|nr:hypothetical protein [Armatimonadota bacterium]